MSVPQKIDSRRAHLIHYLDDVPKSVNLALNTDIKQAIVVGITVSKTCPLHGTTSFTRWACAYRLKDRLICYCIANARTNDINAATNTTATWGALRFFTYSAIIQHLASCFICLMVIKMCTDVPHHAQQLIANHNGNKEPSRALRVARGEVLPRGISNSHYRLLEEFGMSPRYRFIDSVILPALIAGAFTFAFIALTIWIWATQSTLNAGITMITVVPALLSLLFVFGISLTSQGWH